MRSDFETAAAKMPVPAEVQYTRASAAGVVAEWLEPTTLVERRVVLYLHGGAYVAGSLNTIRSLAAHLARAAASRVLTVEYRLAPEHTFPAPVEDALTAYEWLLGEGYASDGLAIGGDSAGGGLAVATLVAIRDRGLPLPRAGVCISPWTDLSLSGASLDSNAIADPECQRWLLERMATQYLAGQDARTPLASPLFADLTALPPLLIQVGGVETLLDDATGLASAAEAAGVDVTLERWDNMIHVWHRFAPRLPEAAAAIERVGEWLRGRWSEQAAPTSHLRTGYHQGPSRAGSTRRAFG
jgi:acetyl esterase/lipase